jgi:hypothetical protein
VTAVSLGVPRVPARPLAERRRSRRIRVGPVACPTQDDADALAAIAGKSQIPVIADILIDEAMKLAEQMERRGVAADTSTATERLR